MLSDNSDTNEDANQNADFRSFIMKKLDDDMPAADVKWSLFVAALLSYRHSSILRPFPRISTQAIQLDLGELTNKQYTYLAKIVDRVPRFCSLKQENALLHLDDEAVELIHWSLSNPLYDIESCKSSVYEQLVANAGQEVKVLEPTSIFKISYPNDTFEIRSIGKKRFHAFHGSRLDNFHSILSYGLQGSLNKNSLFGDGTYLSSELSVSFSYCPLGQCWEKSEFGSSVSCVAYCDIIDDVLVKLGTKNSRAKSRVKGSVGGTIPEKYYLVQNSEVLAVKYILLYASCNGEPPSVAPAAHRGQSAVLYILLMLTVSLYSSSRLKSLVNGLYRKYFGPNLL